MTSSITSCASCPRFRFVRRIDPKAPLSCSTRPSARVAQPSRLAPGRDGAGELRHATQLCGRAVGDDAAAVDDDGARAGGVDFLEDVGREDDRLVRAELADQLLTSCFWFGSRPSVGSSMISTSGSCRSPARGRCGACSPSTAYRSTGAARRRKQQVDHAVDRFLPRGAGESAQLGDELEECARPSCRGYEAAFSGR